MQCRRAADGALVVPLWIGSVAVDVVLDLTSATTRLSPDALWLAGAADRRTLRRTGRRLRVRELRLGGATLRECEVVVEPALRADVEGTLGTAALAALGVRIDVAAARLTFRRQPDLPATL